MNDETFDKSRVINFSDAVFSVAMTLLILEVVIPSYAELKNGNTLEILKNRIPSFIGFIVSFMVTALYWVAHMRIFKYVSTIDTKILWLNIFVLLFIVLLPFSTAFYVKGFDYKAPFAFYCFNLAAIGFFNFILNVYVPKKEKGATNITPVLASYFKIKSLNVFIIWALAGFLAFSLPIFSRILFIFLFIIEFFIVRYFKKKLDKERNEE